MITFDTAITHFQRLFYEYVMFLMAAKSHLESKRRGENLTGILNIYLCVIWQVAWHLFAFPSSCHDQNLGRFGLVQRQFCKGKEGRESPNHPFHARIQNSKAITSKVFPCLIRI